MYLVLEPDLRIAAVSDAYLAATMTERAAIVGKFIFEVFPDNPADPDATGVRNLRASLDTVLRTGKPHTMAVQKYDIRRPAEEGGGFEERYWSPCNSPLLEDGGRLRYIVHQVEDVTEYIRLREKQVQTDARSRRMEEEILRRSGELQRANEQLRVASTAKDEFLARVSHELRNPLMAIGGFSELLMRDETDVKRREWAAMVVQASGHLAHLVADLLDLARIESGNIALACEPVALGPLFADVLDLMRPLSESAGVTLQPATSAAGHGYAFADKHRLIQVLTNLVINAIKYNRRGGDVRIDVRTAGDHRVRIAVSDTGRGVPAESLERLFTPFDRLDAAASGIEGTGLGLALSRTIVEAMDGTLTVESTPGVGSTFTIELPSGEPAAVERVLGRDQAALTVVDYPVEGRLLYIEDTVANVRLISAILSHRPSVTVLSAMQGSLGLELARQHRPDLILLDLHLPDMGGQQVLAQLKADPATKDIPVIILSADAPEREREQLLAAGADGYMTKPAPAAELIATVDHYLTQRPAATRAGSHE